MINQFVVASHDAEILTKNLLRSPVAKTSIPIHTFPDFRNVPEAYNFLRYQGITCYIHHDVFLPETFAADIDRALDRVPDDWAVLGVAGVQLQNGEKIQKGYISDRGRPWGNPWKLPAPVDTLDEMLLITKSDLIFDLQFPLDFYGADICLQARQQGRGVYAINAFCEHNSSRKFGERTPSFYESQEKFARKWEKYLPIATTCAMITKLETSK